MAHLGERILRPSIWTIHWEKVNLSTDNHLGRSPLVFEKSTKLG